MNGRRLTLSRKPVNTEAAEFYSLLVNNKCRINNVHGTAGFFIDDLAPWAWASAYKKFA